MDSEAIENAQKGRSAAAKPQRGCDLQPTVAASATLGSLAKELFNRKAVAPFPRRIKIGATALRLGFNESLTQGSRSGNPGLEVSTALRFAALPTLLGIFNRL